MRDFNNKARITCFIILSKFIIEGLKEKYINNRFDDYLTKSIKYKLLEKRLKCSYQKKNVYN